MGAGHFIRFASAMPFVLRGANPQTGSSSSSSTSNYGPLPTSLQLHTQKVDPARQGALGNRFASPHTVRSSLDQPSLILGTFRQRIPLCPFGIPPFDGAPHKRPSNLVSPGGTVS